MTRRHRPSCGDLHCFLQKAYERAQTAGLDMDQPTLRTSTDAIPGRRRTRRQFRFRKIVDLETREVLLELEHEVRAVTLQP